MTPNSVEVVKCWSFSSSCSPRGDIEEEDVVVADCSFSFSSSNLGSAADGIGRISNEVGTLESIPFSTSRARDGSSLVRSDSDFRLEDFMMPPLKLIFLGGGVVVR